MMNIEIANLLDVLLRHLIPTIKSKMVLLNILVICISVINFSKSSTLPLEKCKLNDSPCMVSTAQKFIPEFTKGIPELGVEQLDLFHFGSVEFDISGLQFSLKNSKLKGLKNAVMDNITWDVNQKKFSISFHADLEVEGNYVAGGKLLLLPIAGDGIMVLKLKNYFMNVHFDYNIKTVDGKDYVILKKYEFDYDVKDNARFSLSNLFNGNEQLSKTMLTVINDNWKQLTIDFGKPIVEAIVDKLVKNVANFFKNTAFADLAVLF